MLWCWRCRAEMPMLDESEWPEIESAWKAAFRANGKGSIDDRFKPLRDRYFELTGFAEPNELAIIHHRISLYGEPCTSCGKPLRTPKAAFCAACGWRPES